jgi:biopolymer transport protein ExbD
MGVSLGDRGGLKSDINVTPLIDVLLVLLVVFMVVAPMAQMGYEIMIPREDKSATPPPPDEKSKQVILAVNVEICNIEQPLTLPGLPPGCTVLINKEAVRAEELSNKMREIFEKRRSMDKVLFLAAQEKLNYEGVMRIVDMCRAAAGEDLKLGIVTDERIAMGL